MYSKTIKVKNGEIFSYIDFYKCDITGKEFCESDGWIGSDEIQITSEGFEILIEQWIHQFENSCGYPIVLYYLQQRLTKKIRPDRYISKKLRNEVLQKFHHTCCKCGSKEKLEIDHIHPVSKKGISELSNLQVLCKKCNLKKGAKV